MTRSVGSRPDRLRYWLYAAHLFSHILIAASNILLGLAVLAVPWRRVGWAAWWREHRRLLLPLVAYAGWLVVSIMASSQPAASLRAASELLNLFTLVLALLWVRGEADGRRLVDGLILVAVLLALAGLAQFGMGYGDMENRIRGPVSHYMTFAGILMIADLLLLSRMAVGGAWRRLWSWPALLVINTALLGSYTRSAWVGLGVAALLLFAVRAPRRIPALLPAAVLLVALAPVPLLHRMMTIVDLRDPSNYDRLCMAAAGLGMVAERPLFGMGPELVDDRYPIYRHPSAPRYWAHHLHNSFVQLAAERGLPALAAYVWLMAASLALAWRRFQTEGRLAGPRADLLLGTMLALVAFNVAGLFEHNWGDTEVQRPVLYLLALPFCLGDGAEVPGPDPASAGRRG